MRWLAALLMIPFVFAISVGDDLFEGNQPVLYGDMVAFERGGHVRVFDMTHQAEFDVGPGSNPSLFGFGLAYGDAGLIKYVNVRDRKTVTVGQGLFPSIYSDVIVFSAKESQLGADFSNDSDRNDDVIQEYDVKKAELKTINAVGKYPVANQRYIVFVTEESQVGVDLNADGDQNDGVLRIFDRESRSVNNAKVEGRDLAISKEGKVGFVSQGKIAFLDARSHAFTVTDFAGSNPSVHDGLIVFSNNGELFGYSIAEGNIARLGVKGENPSVFGEQAAIVSGGRIRIVSDVDEDRDGVSDFVDNCPSVQGTAADADNDGVGDSCEKRDGPKPEAKPAQQAVSQNQSAVSQSANKEQPMTNNELAWYWYILIIAAVVIAGPYAWKFAIRYYRKRKKSFGF